MCWNRNKKERKMIKTGNRWAYTNTHLTNGSNKPKIVACINAILKQRNNNKNRLNKVFVGVIQEEGS